MVAGPVGKGGLAGADDRVGEHHGLEVVARRDALADGVDQVVRAVVPGLQLQPAQLGVPAASTNSSATGASRRGSASDCMAWTAAATTVSPSGTRVHALRARGPGSPRGHVQRGLDGGEVVERCAGHPGGLGTSGRRTAARSAASPPSQTAIAATCTTVTATARPGHGPATGWPVAAVLPTSPAAKSPHRDAGRRRGYPAARPGAGLRAPPRARPGPAAPGRPPRPPWPAAATGRAGGRARTPRHRGPAAGSCPPPPPATAPAPQVARRRSRQTPNRRPAEQREHRHADRQRDPGEPDPPGDRQARPPRQGRCGPRPRPSRPAPARRRRRRRRTPPRSGASRRR